MSTRSTLTHDGFRRALLAAFAVDILFVPFLLPIPVPLSIFAFPAWLLLAKKRIRLERQFWLFVGASLAFAGYAISLYDPINFDAFRLSKFNNTGLIVFMFLSFAMIDDLRHERLELIGWLLLAYMAFSFGLSAIFVLDPYTYYSLRGVWAFDDSDLAVGPISVITRCTGILSDPNNHAVSICAIAALLVTINRDKLLRNLAIVFASAIVVTTTMSATGFVCLGILGAYFFYSSTITKSKATDFMTKAFLLLVCLGVMALVSQLMENNAIVRLAMERLDQSDLNSRFERWAIIFDQEKILRSLFLGDGGAIYWDNRLYLPHNGHFHVFFAFGGIVYLIFILNFFDIRRWRLWRDAAFLVIIFAGFTVNVGIYEHRFIGIWLLLLAGFHEFAAAQALPRRAPTRSRRGPARSQPA